MPTLAITRRPIMLETQASGAMVTDILANIAAINGRASLYGVDDPVKAALLMSGSIEADFEQQDYRQGYVQTDSLSTLPSWSFSRTGVGSARDAGGQFRPFASGAARITDMGLMSERAATNVLTLYSGAPTVTTGISKLGDAAAALTIVSDTTVLRAAGYGALIDAGQMNGNVYHLDNTSGVTEAYLILPGLTANTNVHTLSALIRGVGQAQFRTASSVPVDSWKTLTNGYQRESVSQVALASGVKASGDPMLVFAAAGTDLYFVLPQMEEGHGATTPVITAGSAATRGADAAAMTLASGSEGAVFVEFDFPSYVPSFEQNVFGWTNGSNQYLGIRRDSGGTLAGFFFKPDGTIVLPASAYTTPTVKAVVGWGGGKFHFTVQGVDETPIALSMTPTISHFYIGRDGAGGEHLNCHIRRLMIFDRLPSVADREAMTGA